MSLALVLDHRVDVDPDGDAISDASRSLTNAQLLDRVRGAARHLKDLGVRPGEVVALKLTNRVEFVVLLFAAWRLGAAVTPINPRLTDVEVDRQLEDSRARLMVTENGATTHAGVVTLAVGDLNQRLCWPDLPAPQDPYALALLSYTSSTTPVPKVVMLDHANLDAEANTRRDSLELETADRCMPIQPMFRVDGVVASILTPLVAGASIVIADESDVHTVAGDLERRPPS